MDLFLGYLAGVLTLVNPCVLPILPKESICDANDEDPEAACEEGVAVPAALFKIVFDPERRRTNAYLMPNEDHRPFKGRESSEDYLTRYRVSVRLIEDFTGYDFFTALGRRAQRVAEQSCTATFFR